MAELVFYEKSGCVGNLKQQSLLRSQGIEFVIRDLLSEPWSAERLRRYFADKPVAEWFNTTAPAVRSGDLPIDDLSEAEALAMMVSNPILIRRPLLKLGELRQSGFVPGAVLEALGVELVPSERLQECPMQEEGSIPCEGLG
ncbi:MAG: hypothetical protein B6D72_18370 [gamma proteobacterium symbiont of Ctena orbiculata]|uniref:Nitrogenase-associated protein n=1 Tax=Candidatus Thiodiazotropha taylori TaxID=2792791 RepID=A0A944MEI3_9GAMM|nr:hypothetical protein [Candidatus Thiodiazotropha taylori]PUB88883.1 MAG: hypothetical protein DBP00_04465 [gamma proteobacterium symbiont of Ctena orbiculata]MBT2990398.1 hypothetical protein [Candidatus Thiodiazotropha taylori]MBT2998051.1 hypothetical protein [Candidatus Thiodiazotropha taylori]MBT3002262.1 hypothetical protein [Candidatus Thiodiazotropha taylori]